MSQEAASAGLAMRYAVQCLSYTFESNRNEERRLNTLIVLSVGALGGAKFMLDLLEADADTLAMVLRVAILLACVPLLCALVAGIRAFRSKVFDATSQMLPEYIAQKLADKPGDYVEEVLAQSDEQIIERVLLENHALAQAKWKRSQRYAHMSHCFMWGAIPMVLLLGFVILHTALRGWLA